MSKLDCSLHLPTNWSPTIFDLIQWKNGDVVISGAAKQGTTWMQNILHQLRTGGDKSFGKINDVCPRPEIIEYPGQSDMERWESWTDGIFREYAFRILKTHTFPPRIQVSDNVKYIIPIRNGRDSLVSLYKYRNNTTNEFKRLWGGLSFPSFDVCFNCYLEQQNYWKLINSWLPYRHLDNVLMVHFSNLKHNPEGSIRMIADFLDISLQEQQWSRVLEYCSFKWMKAHSSLFEPADKGLKALQQGTMIREGGIGSNKDFFTHEHIQRWNSIHEQLLPDRKIRHWCDEGGVLPL